MSQPIEVLGTSARKTRIVVRDWPDARAKWCARTVDDRGRRLQVVGWKNFAPKIVVGELKLHVRRDSRKSLLIVGHSLADTLITGEGPEVLARMVLCAQAIAARLQENGIGDGCLEWELDSRRVGEISRLFDDFSPTSRHKRRHLPGKRYLRSCP